METMIVLLFIACLAGIYLIFSLYYKPGKNESIQGGAFEPPTSLSTINRAFREVSLTSEKEKQCLIADVYAIVPDQDNLGMIEIDMCYFFKDLSRYFQKSGRTRPNLPIIGWATSGSRFFLLNLTWLKFIKWILFWKKTFIYLIWLTIFKSLMSNQQTGCCRIIVVKRANVRTIFVNGICPASGLFNRKQQSLFSRPGFYFWFVVSF